LSPSFHQCLAVSVIAGLLPAAAQTTTNPLASNPSNIERGRHHFVNNCGICHGFNAQGGDKGPSLNTGQFRHGISDSDLFRSITQGISGTAMPANNLPAEEVWAMIIFLRSTVVAARAPATGNRDAGEKIFWTTHKCANCHMAKGKGGVLGPDLSRIGAAKTISYLTEKLRDPNKELTKGLHEPNGDYVVPISNATVTVVTASGQRITGVPKNEDTFSIQMLGTDNEIHVFSKKDLKEVIHEMKSLMPAYDQAKLSDGELTDLLAYLAALH
jgi:cytochrome c oxidase cbb3-type subunit 3